MGAFTAPSAAESNLDRITVQGTRILDTEGRDVVLRGLVAITSLRPDQQVERTYEDYRRMARAWGMNAQVIRLEACRLGASPECNFDPAYLEKLDRWTQAAARAGVYTMFKMTTYDAPSWGVGAAFGPARWQEFWDDKDDQQEVHIEGWRRVWRHFKGVPAVVGYDVLNEPHSGTKTDPINRDHLFKYYAKASQALREIDPDAALLFQPAPYAVVTEDLEPLDDPHPLFAPHFYPRTLEQYEPYEQRHLQLADEFGYAVIYGEYGLPDTPFRNPNKPDEVFMPGWSPEAERKAALIFDRNGLGNIRPWYVHGPYWSVLNADGSEHEKMNILARPYPQRTAGRHKGWKFDFDTKDFELALEPSGAIDTATRIYVARRRHYPEGFTVVVDAMAVAFDKDGRLVDADAPPPGLRYDPDTDMIEVDARDRPTIIRISRR